MTALCVKRHYRFAIVNNGQLIGGGEEARVVRHSMALVCMYIWDTDVGSRDSRVELLFMHDSRLLGECFRSGSAWDGGYWC